MQRTFAWTNHDGTIAVTTCADGVDPEQEVLELARRGQIPKGSEIVFDPVLPSAPGYQWEIRNGHVVANPGKPEPFEKRKDLQARIQNANSVAVLRQIVQEMLE